MSNGTFVADMAYEDGAYSKKYVKVGSILYFRSHDAKLKLIQSPPIDQSIIGKFIPSQKIPAEDAPYIEGDLFSEGIKLGHIHSEQNETGETLYWIKFIEEFSMDGFKQKWINIKLEDI